MSLFGFRIVRDYRVKAFSRKSAERFLRKSNSLYKPITDEMWEALQQTPNDDLITAYTDYCYEMDFFQKR